MKDFFPEYLTSYANLRDHFEENFDGLQPRERGQKFAKVVQGVVPHTSLESRGFGEPELQQESHDEGVDLIATHPSSRDVLCIQSKYTLRDKNDLDSVINKFQSYHAKHFADTAGPFFALSRVSIGDEPTAYFQIVSGNDLHNVLRERS